MNGNYLYENGVYITKTEKIIIIVIAVIAFVNGAFNLISGFIDINSNWLNLIVGCLTVLCGIGVLFKKRFVLIIIDSVYLVALIVAVIGVFALFGMIGYAGGAGASVAMTVGFGSLLSLAEIIVSMVLIHTATKALSKKTQEQRRAEMNA